MSKSGRIAAARLDALEADIRSVLAVELPSVARGANTLFFHTEGFNPHGLGANYFSPVAGRLVAAAMEATALRERLGLRDDGAPSALYLAACRENAVLSDDHRLGPIRLAQRLMADLDIDGVPR